MTPSKPPPSMTEPALALIDFSSIATGIEAADAMIKRADIQVLKAGTVQPGRYLVLIGGRVAEVGESLAAGREVGGDAVVDFIFLPHVHPEVVHAIGGGRVPGANEALGVVETTTVPAAIHAADAGIKGADVHLVEVRLADGLGGKGVVLYSGVVGDVEAAVEIGVSVLERPGLVVRKVVIPQLHAAMWENMTDATRFSARVLERL
ncbi:MAG TPA: BMC domain-containing protein [Gemmatimonadales bacterium]|nr:BMC domain-containing protein [Gemmatimonadales bacterium]